MTTKAKDKGAPADGDQEEGGDDGEHEPTADDDALVEAVASRVLELLGADGETGGPGGDGGGGGDGTGAGGAPRSAADTERAMADAVKKAMGELAEKERAEGRIAALEAKVEKRVVEQAPVSVRRITRLLWGAGDTR